MSTDFDKMISNYVAAKEAGGIEAGIVHWAQLAVDADRWADYERENGRYDGVHRNKAKLYRDTAESLRLEQKTGEPHCSCHLILMTTCAALARKGR